MVPVLAIALAIASEISHVTRCIAGNEEDEDVPKANIAGNEEDEDVPEADVARPRDDADSGNAKQAEEERARQAGNKADGWSCFAMLHFLEGLRPLRGAR